MCNFPKRGTFLCICIKPPNYPKILFNNVFSQTQWASAASEIARNEKSRHVTFRELNTSVFDLCGGGDGSLSMGGRWEIMIWKKLQVEARKKPSVPNTVDETSSPASTNPCFCNRHLFRSTQSIRSPVSQCLYPHVSSWEVEGWG